VANKTDLDERRVITTDMGRDLAKSKGLAYFEISAVSDPSHCCRQNNNNNNINNCPTNHCERRLVGNLECLYKACQAARTDGGLFTETGVEERGENDCEKKTIS